MEIFCSIVVLAAVVVAIGLFNRRKKVTPEKQHEALRVLAEWEHAQNSTEWRRASQRLAALGGWEWWLAVARAAESDKSYKLVGQVNCYTIQSKGVMLGESGYSPNAT